MAALRVLLVAALLVLPLWAAQTAPARACSLDLNETVRQSELVVTGIVQEMTVLPPKSVEHPESLGGGFTPVEVTVVVDDYLRGSGPSALRVFQPAAPIEYRAGRLSHITGGVCGFGISTGERYVMLLSKYDSLRYSGYGHVLTDAASDQDFLAQVQRLLSQTALLPPTGSGSPHHSAPIVPLVAASALASLGLAANAAFVLRRRS